ncbi:putative bifunctional diguanylate cyclase/phosphodiesterase [Shewanella marina]|uniref:putative bifunctional diguanylate cyclase/phosphodiesterase n=1 Tax=Shewanella marina TaxID=487319 RepID=UPI000ACB6F0F|nr:EAL domain-containing protein [Shewanella marina]
MKWFNSRTAIIIAGILLTGYLILILAVTNLGQSKLEASHNDALDLKVKNYTDNLSFFFDVSQENINNLTKNRAVNTYFSNLASGMSIQYGLGSSLYNLKQKLAKFEHSNQIDDAPIFNRLTIVGMGQTIIADTDPSKPFNITKIPLKQMEHQQSKILTLAGHDGPTIKLLHTIYFQQKPVAVLIAEVNNHVLIHQLSTQEHAGNKSCLKLITPVSDILVWDSLRTAHDLSLTGRQPIRTPSNAIYLEKSVSGTPFKLVSWFQPVTEQDIFTSTWFIAGISLLALPVLLGLFYLMRVNNANLVLQTQVAVSAEQQLKLTTQNELLHDEIQKRKASEQKLAYQASHDELTGLSNRTYSIERLRQAIAQSQLNHTQILVMFLDLDNFKQINDTLGHHAGDTLLQKTGERLLKSVRKTDTVARLGGDEFLIIIPELPNQSTAEMLADSILSIFETPFEAEQQEFFVSTSIGMSIYPQDGHSAEELLKKADTALYRAKDAGRNGFSFYDASMNHDVLRKLELNVRLHQAINQDQFEVYYQPILDLKSGKIVAAEALLRWNDSELGFVPPDQFIPIAEKNGLIHRLGDIVLHKACTQAAHWQSISPIKIAINFSSVQFRYCEQLQLRIVEVLAATGLPANKLDMEVTESLLIEQDNSLRDMLAYLKQLGIELSIDDFGTGYSALSYLQRFAFSKLKIDRAFINNMMSNEADRTLVKAILAMAKSLQLQVVAEGIECQQQMDFLIQHGCEFGQGYLFSRPVPAAEFTQLLSQQA